MKKTSSRCSMILRKQRSSGLLRNYEHKPKRRKRTVAIGNPILRVDNEYLILGALREPDFAKEYNDGRNTASSPSSHEYPTSCSLSRRQSPACLQTYP